MSDFTLAIKNRTAEELAVRREYGAPIMKGEHYKWPDGREEFNTNPNRFCQYIHDPMEIQKLRFKELSETRFVAYRYVQFLQDYFYRKYKGYTLPYIEEPEDPAKVELWNQVAIECGHPEYMIMKVIEDNNTVQVDVLDEEGNVVAQSVGSKAEEQQPDPAESEHPEEKAGAENINPEDKDKAEDNQDEKKQDAVIFNEIGPGGSCWVEEERIKEFSANNEKFVKQYPPLQKLVDICSRNGLLCKLYDNHGLVRADVYIKGSLAVHKVYNIDPAKIRNQYSIIYADLNNPDPNISNPFIATLIGFDEPYFEAIVVNGMADQGMLQDSESKSSVNRAFFKHISYNAIPNEDIAVAASNTYHLCNKMDTIEELKNIRFKVVKYVNKDTFDLLCFDKVGLGYYANNGEYSGLKLEVRAACNNVVTRASGSNADKFVKLMEGIVVDSSVTDDDINNILGIAKTVNEAAAEKQKNQFKQINPGGKGKGGKKIEVPSGR